MNIVEYIKETKSELKHVNWPSKSQALNYTLLVIGISVAVAVVLAIADHFFALGLESLILSR